MRVVLDNNVFISGIFWEGLPHRIIKLAEENKVEIFTTLEILKELFGVLKREKFKPLFREGETNIEEVFGRILGLVKICTPKIEIKIIKKDPPDNKFLACATTAQASFIISGDKHLLNLKKFKGISIISPRRFLRIIKR